MNPLDEQGHFSCFTQGEAGLDGEPGDPGERVCTYDALSFANKPVYFVRYFDRNALRGLSGYLTTVLSLPRSRVQTTSKVDRVAWVYGPAAIGPCGFGVPALVAKLQNHVLNFLQHLQ